MVCEQLEAIFFHHYFSVMYALCNTFSAKNSKYWAFHITAYVEIFAYVCVYCLCIGPCFYDIVSVVFKIFVQLLAPWGRVHHRHSISPIYCYHSDRDILNCHKTFTIDNMFMPFWTKLFQRCTNQQFWNKYLYKVTGRIETLVSLRITHINGNINTNVKKSIQNKSYWFWIDFLRLCLCFHLCS